MIKSQVCWPCSKSSFLSLFFLLLQKWKLDIWCFEHYYPLLLTKKISKVKYLYAGLAQKSKGLYQLWLCFFSYVFSAFHKWNTVWYFMYCQRWGKRKQSYLKGIMQQTSPRQQGNSWSFVKMYPISIGMSRTNHELQRNYRSATWNWTTSTSTFFCHLITNLNLLFLPPPLCQMMALLLNPSSVFFTGLFTFLITFLGRPR